MKKKERRKVNYKKIIIVFAIILFGILLFFGYRSLKVKTIYVIGNNLVRENEILENTNLLSYPPLYQVSEKDIKEALSDNKLISDIRLKKTLSGKVTIEVSENKVLYQNTDGKYILSNKEEVDIPSSISGIPVLLNDPKDKKDKLIDKMLLIERDILLHISEIEYKPTDLDKERFMFYMSDGNYVYITLNKINLINSYNEIYPTLEGRKGILYLDSGNHFEIKNKNEIETQ